MSARRGAAALRSRATSSPGFTRRTSGRASCPAARSSASLSRGCWSNPPDIIIMDESTAALDEESQARMLEFLRTDLAPATVLCVAHRPGLEEYFDREIQLVRLEGGGPGKGAAPASAALPQPPEAVARQSAGERRGPCAGGRGAPAREPVPTSEEGAGAEARERSGARARSDFSRARSRRPRGPSGPRPSGRSPAGLPEGREGRRASAPSGGRTRPCRRPRRR